MGLLSFSTLLPTSNDNKFNLLAKILLATLGGEGGNASIIGQMETLLDSLVGVSLDYGGTTAPNGFVLAYGQTVSRSTYSALFAKYGTTYNTGGEAGTDFRLPDLRGRVVAGKDNMGGASANRITNLIDGDVLGASGSAESVAVNATEEVDSGSGAFAFATAEETTTTLQPTIILNKIIFTGVFS